MYASKGVSISRETVRKWLIDAGMWEGKKRSTAELDASTKKCAALKQAQ